MTTSEEADSVPVVFINSFEVGKGKEEEFVAAWKKVKEQMEKQDGFISTALHQSLSEEAPFRFVNVVQWQSKETLEAAFASPEFRRTAPVVAAVVQGSHPCMYRVIER
ncbi:hypothetical protein M758_4G157100 [Ceratodon purpureus]|uniref:ABM domain-containing protein n=1 Tax=Ceratodon purpureus TaxID=3225 RepID=A0A8T0IBB8_CERPU|nr:hypothetical protein KC19_4G156400 [Ceratodon purpureus]KAG0619684.1 hypothetical protein M758_4G157100 [Ceratodon purpureus]